MEILKSKQIKFLLWWLALIVIVTGHGFVLFDFVQETTILTKGVCCGLADTTLVEIFRDHNQGPPLTDWDLNRGWLPLVGKWVFEGLGHNPRALLIVSSTSVLLTGVILCLAVIKLGANRWLALLVPFMLPLSPVIAFSARRWDVHGPSLLILSIGLWLLSYTRHFTKIVPSVGFALLAMAAGFFSPRETDNILLLMSLLSMALGVGLSGFILGKSGNLKVSRPRVALIGVGVATGVLLFVWSELRFTSPTGAGYYLFEAKQRAGDAQLAWNSPKQLMGYLSYLFWRGWGSTLAIPAEIALIWLIVRRKLPSGIFFGFVLPLMVLSLITKKNYYYSSVVWFYPVILIPLAITYLPRYVGAVFGTIVIIANVKPFWARAYPASPNGIEWQEHARLLGTPNFDGIMQTSDQGLPITPSIDSWPQSITERLEPLIPNDGCRKQWRVMLYGILDMEELQIRLSEKFPCVDFQCDPPYTDLDNAGIVMIPDIGAAPLEEAKLKVSGQGMTEQSIVLGPDNEKIYIYRRPDKWFMGRGGL